MEARIVPASLEHAAQIAQSIRLHDKDEAWAAGLITPYGAMVEGVKYSDVAYTAFVDDVPVCMWGVVKDSFLFDHGTPWMMASTAVEQNIAKFLRASRPLLREIMTRYDSLENFVDARNTLSIRWLKWLGFTIEDAAPHGALSLPFHRFWMKREVSHV